MLDGKLWDGLDQLQRDLEWSDGISDLVAGTAIVLSAALSTGFVVWVLRGGYLLSFMISSMPAWTLIDPLPILESWTPSGRQDLRNREANENTLDEIFSDLGAPSS